ncbi:TonB-dependent receptor [Chryseolinea sp. H1M3-3]|uniref:TonB-dependent receptor n=1 Tax=Chryseolinea sp. H1M3-3 TaxID=3034144 RepID=UPI0023EE0CB4|nr:TonB-dependent receptor [Chryseolinea sp. H1M3-3]
MFKSIVVAAAMLWTTGALAQKYAITGTVRDVQRNEVLAGATVQIQNTDHSAVTNDLGKFVVKDVPTGNYTVVVRFLGYLPTTKSVTLDRDVDLDIRMESSSTVTEEVVVYATRANEKTPTTFSYINKEAIQKQNFGQDIPMLLNWSPSMVTTSDAGAGIGYTGLRIRGSDASRINVTINGIALNDSESQGVFWVNTPDLASSIQSIQVQRGVGTSTNGAGAFGATVSVQTDVLSREAYAEGIASFGSFNSQRYTFKGGTGLIKDRWSFDARVSKITSDGYLRRATSDLNSYYLSGGYYGDKTIIKAIMFGGHEQTYQAWYGVDQATMEQDRRFNYSGAIYDDDCNIIRFYDREVDDYRQDHYQLHISQQLSAYWNGNISFHYTDGKGYFEQYKQDESFANLGLPDVTIGNSTIESSDVVVRRWLDNDYYGTTFSANYTKGKTNLTIGGAASKYDNARHFGEILWAEVAINAPLRHVYYDGESQKTDFNVYAKWNYSLTDVLTSYVDLQYRAVNYETAGVDNDQSLYAIKDEFDFFNPKVGLSYSLSGNSTLYASYAIANREPNRTDYLDGLEKPKSERLGNLELGWRKTTSKFGVEANYYLMNYTNQLVLTGELNDVGSPIRANVGRSYRMGIELSALINFTEKISWNVNATWSVNKNKDYTLFDENNNAINRNTTIILSPAWIAGSQFNWKPFTNFQASLLSKYVGKQYLDNTQDERVTLDDYFINDIRLTYQIHPKGIKEIEFGFLVNNLLDVEYSSNGYGYDGTPYFYPQAGLNFLAMVSVKL